MLHRAAQSSGDTFVLTHGAGGNADGRLLVDLADAFTASGTTVLRCDLPFRQARPTGPPSRSSGPIDRAGLAHAVDALKALGGARVFVGGQSYGGRQASMLVAEQPDLAAGLLLLSYPLHAPATPTKLRIEHLPKIHVPTVFVHGSSDPFGTTEEIESARRLISAPTTLIVAAGGHDLGYRKRNADLITQIVGACAAAWR